MIILDGTEVKVEHFPDGTQRIVLENLPNMEWRNTHEITWKFEREEELSTLIYVTRHLRNMPCIQEICLNLLYLPNARMDRIHNHKEVFTLRGFADAINWLRFDVVRVLDVHSNVGAALLNNVLVCTPEKYLKEVIDQIDETVPLVLYFPDEGAAKRYSGLLPGMKYCYGEKKRDWETGKILGLAIKTNGIDLQKQTVLMVDDIIAYGGSLYYSAKELKRMGADTIYAYATHTENSILDKEKGTLIKLLEDNTVERLFTTGSLFIGEHDKITVLEVQKMCSIVASMATMAFNRFFMYEYEEFNRWIYEGSPTDEDKRLNDVYYNAMCQGAMFDARVFNIPKEEVTNNIYWRQLDASRNSIQMLGQANFSHRELLNKTCNQIQDMLMTQHGINWNDMGTSYKRGSCCVRNRRVISTSADGTVTCEIRNPKEPETAWVIDNEIPIFKGEGRKYIDELIFIGGVEI